MDSPSIRPEALRAAIAGALACTASVAPVTPQQVERWFSTGFYPRIQRAATTALNQLPIAVFDVLLLMTLIGLVWVLIASVRTARRLRSGRPLAQGMLRIATAAAVVYLVFLSFWGFNYRRVPMQQRLALRPAAPGADDVRQLGERAVSELNARYERAHTEGWSGHEWQNAALRQAFTDVQRTLASGEPAVPARLKQTALGPYFRWTSVDGMVNPFGLEVLANPDLLPFERPFVAAHEWGHLAGYANESEASFVGWLTCLKASDAAQYSGWLFVYWQVAGELPDGDRGKLSALLAEGPRRDVSAVLERLRRGQLPLLRRTSWLVYDQYLKANRVEEGVRSYSLALTLILRTRFDASGAPIRRP